MCGSLWPDLTVPSAHHRQRSPRQDKAHQSRAVAWIEIPSDAPIFLTIVGLHVMVGLACDLPPSLGLSPSERLFNSALLQVDSKTTAPWRGVGGPPAPVAHHRERTGVGI